MSYFDIDKSGRRRLGAVVLGRADYGEADLIVTFLTRELGLVTALARYGRRSIRRFGGGLLSPGTAAWYDFTFKTHTDLAFVEEAEANPRVAHIGADPVRQGLASFALELVRGFETPGNPAGETFALLVRHLGRLARCQGETAARRLALDFSLNYMELAGFGPRLDACLTCGAPVGDEPGWRWDPLAGGLLCPNCPDAGDKRVRRMRPRLLRRLCLGTCPASELTEDDLTEAELFFERLAEEHLGRKLKAMKAVRRLLAGP
ncbi:MAG: DNA repair protein RecO [Candidatus Adiutrix sp.]|jgi:DNA repair protein RecO (recombination protein O)|nr:DNA repair protein RecO [Candidatus Adiutrix sp.]